MKKKGPSELCFILQQFYITEFRELLERIRVVDDNPSERALSLHCSGRIKERSKVFIKKLFAY